MNYRHILLIFKALVLLFVFAGNLSAGFANPATPFPDRIILNLTQDASSSLSVTWRTDISVSEGWCEVRLSPAGRIDNSGSASYRAQTTTIKYEYDNNQTVEVSQHYCDITELTPGRKYIYRVGGAGHWSEWFEFQTPSNDKSGFSFVYFGDPQTDLKSQWSRVVRKAYQTVPQCSFMLYGGDIINRAGNDAEWDQWFSAGSYIFGTVPQVLTPGNHDYNELELDPHWKYQFNQPKNGPNGLKETCFFVDYKNCKIISIDSAVEGELENENGIALVNQKIWLDSVLAANTKEWVIVTTHLPFYSTKESRDNPQMRKHFQPILEKYGVDMALTGHDHSYGRGIATDGKNKAKSLVYVVSVSGPKMYEVGNKDWMQFKGDALQLFHELHIEGNKLHFKTYNAQGQLFDEFKLVKNRKGKNRFVELNTNAIK